MIPRRRNPNGESKNHASGAHPSAKETRPRPLISGRLKLGVGLLVLISIFIVSDRRKVNSSVVPEQPAVNNNAVAESAATKKDPWKFFNGDLNKFYNNLEKDIVRDPKNIDNYAVHRWMGDKHSTYEHYTLMRSAVKRYHPFPDKPKRMFDGGCGLGAGLMWFEREEPEWTLLGHTISETQYDWIENKIPKHKFAVNLASYDDLDREVDFIYSIEALLHSPNLTHTMEAWANHLDQGGMIIVIDDFLAIGARRDDEEVAEFIRSWQAPSLVTPTEMVLIAKQFGLQVKEARDLNAEYQINEMHYRNELEAVAVSGDRTHQAWKGSKVRGRCMVLGKMTYHMMVFQKPVTKKTCTSVTVKGKDESGATFAEVSPDNVNIGGDLSSSYYCNKGNDWFDRLKANETEASLGKVEREVFGSYKDAFASRLNEFYKTLPAKTFGKFVNIASGSAKSLKEASQAAGPLEYWTLAPDTREKNQTLVCDISYCPAAPDCSFDVTYSHGVLEHTKQPWDALDEIARMTKQGGLTMHVTPFSFPLHGEDNYRFSHTALKSLLEERGFTVLDAGYDICTKSKSLRRRDEPFDLVWLTYIVASKK